MNRSQLRLLASHAKGFLAGRRTAAQTVNHARMALGEMGPVLSYGPPELSFSITDRCNLHCDMCLTHSKNAPHIPYGHKATSSDMRPEDFRRVVDRYPGATTVYVIGVGEPMLHPHYFEMVEYAIARKMAVFTTSNGTSIGQHRDRLVRTAIHDLTVSVNSPDGEDFFRMTGHPPKLFDRIVENVRALVDLRDRVGSPLRVAAAFIVDRQNCSRLQEMVDLAADLKVDHAFLHSFMPSPVAGFLPEERCVFEDDAECLEAIAHLKVPERLRVARPVLVQRDGFPRVCDTFFRKFRVDAAMNIGGCTMQLLDLTQNGAFDQPDPWNGPYFQRMRAIFLDPDRPLPEPCRWCPCNQPVTR